MPGQKLNVNNSPFKEGDSLMMTMMSTTSFLLNIRNHNKLLEEEIRLIIITSEMIMQEVEVLVVGEVETLSKIRDPISEQIKGDSDLTRGL